MRKEHGTYYNGLYRDDYKDPFLQSFCLSGEGEDAGEGEGASSKPGGGPASNKVRLNSNPKPLNPEP